MIVGIIGPPKSGKATLAKYLERKLDFEVIDIRKICTFSQFETKNEAIAEEISSEESKDVSTAISQESSPKLSRKVSTDQSGEQDEEQQVVCTVAGLESSERAAKVKSTIQKCLERDWRKRYVLYPIPESAEIAQLVKNQINFVLYKVDSPLKNRLSRSDKSIEEFVDECDEYEQSFIGDHSIKVQATFFNKQASKDDFEKELDGFQFNNENLVRPEWDTYFMRLAYLVASRTNCMKRAVGSVIVKDNRIVAAGYNGTPFKMVNCNQGGCARCNMMTQAGTGLDMCFCIHAEENAIIEAGRAKTEGATIYVTTFPCLMCAKKLVQAGITRVVFDRDYDMPITKQFLALLPNLSIEQKSP